MTPDFPFAQAVSGSPQGQPAATFGLVPRVSNSNKTHRTDRVTKHGWKPGRTALVQSSAFERWKPYQI